MRHRFHAICPYFAMFPESFVEKWVSLLTEPGESVLDPFCGRGSTPFQALLMDRAAVASDINPVAYCITRAKTNAPCAAAVRARLSVLESSYQPRAWSSAASALPEFFHACYASETLKQIVHMRTALNWSANPTDCMLGALSLGILHGESNKSPSYLSNQMPRTISTKPAYSVRWWRRHGFVAPDRDCFELLRRAITFRYASDPPKGTATVLNQDIRKLPYEAKQLRKRIRLAVTSPPYFNVTNFEEDQWLRLWFLGGPPYPTRKLISRDDRYEDAPAYWAFLCDMWRVLGFLMGAKSNVVIRLGARRLTPEKMVSRLRGTSRFASRKVKLVAWEHSPLKRRQTQAFRPGARGCTYEVDCHFAVA